MIRIVHFDVFRIHFSQQFISFASISFIPGSNMIIVQFLNQLSVHIGSFEFIGVCPIRMLSVCKFTISLNSENFFGLSAFSIESSICIEG